MTKKRAKELNLEVINKEHKKFEKMINLEIEVNGNAYKFQAFEVFPPSKVYSLTTELVTKFKDDVQMVDTDTAFLSYVYLLIIRHFTSLPIPSDYAQQIAILEKLVDLDLFNAIIEALPQDQVSAVVQKCHELVIQVVNRSKQLREMLEDQLANAELEEQLFTKVDDE